MRCVATYPSDLSQSAGHLCQVHTLVCGDEKITLDCGTINNVVGVLLDDASGVLFAHQLAFAIAARL